VSAIRHRDAIGPERHEGTLRPLAGECLRRACCSALRLPRPPVPLTTIAVAMACKGRII
jgi:hypothetical protein